MSLVTLQGVTAPASIRDFEKNVMAKTVGLSASVWIRTEDVCYRKATLRQKGGSGGFVWVF